MDHGGWKDDAIGFAKGAVMIQWEFLSRDISDVVWLWQLQ